MKHISILIPEGEASLMDIIGSYKAFKRANIYLQQHGREPMFQVQMVGTGEPKSYEQGLFTITPQVTLTAVKKTDLVIVPAVSWNFTKAIADNKVLLPWITAKYRQGAEVASMCVGGFLLAATGLLDGRTCSTHWAAEDAFRKMFPGVNLLTDKLITDECGIYTNGGAMSFTHLLLYLLEKYCGRECAIYCAKLMEVDIDRCSQSPFTMFTGLKDHHDEEIKKVQLYLETNLDEKVNFEQLSKSLGIGRRNFDRRFFKATFNTPVEYQQRIRVEAAKKMLETSRKTIHETMYDVGYSDMKAFRDVFKRITGLSPLNYRNKYNKQVATAMHIGGIG
jgi:transcriptional regulator GlxA family with amidase domain